MAGKKIHTSNIITSPIKFDLKSIDKRFGKEIIARAFFGFNKKKQPNYEIICAKHVFNTDNTNFEKNKLKEKINIKLKKIDKHFIIYKYNMYIMNKIYKIKRIIWQK